MEAKRECSDDPHESSELKFGETRVPAEPLVRLQIHPLSPRRPGVLTQLWAAGLVFLFQPHVVLL